MRKMRREENEGGRKLGMRSEELGINNRGKSDTSYLYS